VDLHTVSSYRRARYRGDLALAPGETLLAGGTWLFSETQPHVTRLPRDHPWMRPPCYEPPTAVAAAAEAHPAAARIEPV